MRKSTFLSVVLSLCLLILPLFGCENSNKPSGVGDSIPVIGSSLDMTGAYVQSAKSLVVSAKPETNAAGKKILDAATVQHDLALDKIKEGKSETAQAEKERDAVEKKYSDSQAETARVKATYGYRIEVGLKWAFWLVMAGIIFHVVGGIAASFIPGPIGIFLNWSAALINPLAIFQKIKDTLVFKAQLKNATAEVAK